MTVVLSNDGHFINDHFTLLVSCPLYFFVVLCFDEHRNMKSFWRFNLPFVSQHSHPITFNARRLSHQVIGMCLFFIGCACEVFLSFLYALIFVFLFRKNFSSVFNHVNLIIWLTLALRIWSSLWLCSLVFNHVNLIIWLTLALIIWSSLWLCSSVFNHAKLIIWLTFALRIWSSLWLCSSVFNHAKLIIWITLALRIFNHANLIIWLTLALRIWSLWFYSSVFNHVNLIIWLSLALRIWSSLWLYSSKLNLMWRFYSYRDFY